MVIKSRRINTLRLFLQTDSYLTQYFAEVAIKLMRNMLKWDCDERITVQGILDSDFIQLVRTAHPSIVQVDD